MKIGTKSVLFGAHCFFIHPIFVFLAWWKLYGFPCDPRLWVAFIVHDLGYIGKPNMDREEGEAHVFLGAQIMSRLFGGDIIYETRLSRAIGTICNFIWGKEPQGTSWYCFSFYHSRFMSKRYGVSPSKLCFADKMAIALEPWWFYLPRVKATGEVSEYRSPERMKSKNWSQPLGSDKEWFLSCQKWCRNWVAEHIDGRDDSWTPAKRTAI